VSCLLLAPLGACGGNAHAPTYDDRPSESSNPTRNHAGSSDPAAAATTDAGTSAPADSAPAACNALVDRATAVPADNDEGPFPNFEGGAVTPGTYVATRVAYYTGSGGSPAGPLYPGLDETLVIDATTVQAVNLDGALASRWSASWSVNGTTLRWSHTCPDHETVEYGFTATTTSLSLGRRADGNDLVITYQKVD